MSQSDPTTLLSPFDVARVKIKEDKIVYAGYARVHQVTFQHPTFEDIEDLTVTREIFESGNAVVIIPYDVILDEICLIEQLRMAPLMAGEHPWLIEAIAGRIDDGTTAEAIARKEAKEEAGCAVTDLIEIGTFFQSPGIFAEKITYFVGRSDLAGIGGTHGLDTEHEDIRAVRLNLPAALEAMRAGVIRSAPTVLALQYLQLHLDEIRSLWQS